MTDTSDETPVLAVAGLVKHFPARRGNRRVGGGVVHALCGPTFQVRRGETFGIVGESGSGKTTLLRTILGLQQPTAGSVLFDGADITGVKKGPVVQAFRRSVSVVFQDPYTSLDPRMTVADLLREPGMIQRRPVTSDRIDELLDSVHLPRSAVGRFPHEFSGGQRQRIAIARALVLDPTLIVLDEPVSALDVSVQAEVLELLRSLQRERDISYLLVAHDLAVVAETASRVGVMYGGQMVEQGPVGDVIHRPEHPYTRALLAAVPIPEPRLQRPRVRILPPVWPTADSQPEPCRYGDIR